MQMISKFIKFLGILRISDKQAIEQHKSDNIVNNQKNLTIMSNHKASDQCIVFPDITLVLWSEKRWTGHVT